MAVAHPTILSNSGTEDRLAENTSSAEESISWRLASILSILDSERNSGGAMSKSAASALRAMTPAEGSAAIVAHARKETTFGALMRLRVAQSRLASQMDFLGKMGKPASRCEMRDTKNETICPP